jgi:hypothetical protein
VSKPSPEPATVGGSSFDEAESPSCLHCGYALRGVPADAAGAVICPECGGSSADPPFKPLDLAPRWWLRLVGLGALLLAADNIAAAIGPTRLGVTHPAFPVLLILFTAFNLTHALLLLPEPRRRTHRLGGAEAVLLAARPYAWGAWAVIVLLPVLRFFGSDYALLPDWPWAYRYGVYRLEMLAATAVQVYVLTMMWVWVRRSGQAPMKRQADAAIRIILGLAAARLAFLAISATLMAAPDLRAFNWHAFFRLEWAVLRVSNVMAIWLAATLLVVIARGSDYFLKPAT